MLWISGWSEARQGGGGAQVAGRGCKFRHGFGFGFGCECECGLDV